MLESAYEEFISFNKKNSYKNDQLFPITEEGQQESKVYIEDGSDGQPPVILTTLSQRIVSEPSI